MAHGRLLPTSLVRDRRIARLSQEAYAYFLTASRSLTVTGC